MLLIFLERLENRQQEEKFIEDEVGKLHFFISVQSSRKDCSVFLKWRKTISHMGGERWEGQSEALWGCLIPSWGREVEEPPCPCVQLCRFPSGILLPGQRMTQHPRKCAGQASIGCYSPDVSLHLPQQRGDPTSGGEEFTLVCFCHGAQPRNQRIGDRWVLSGL